MSGQKIVCSCLRGSVAKKDYFCIFHLPSSIFHLSFYFALASYPVMGVRSTDGTKEAVKISEYKKMMDAQKQKSDLAAEEEALKKVPDPTVDSYERMGDGYLKQGNLDKAFITYNKGLNLDPKSIRIRYKMAGLFLTKRPGEGCGAGVFIDYSGPARLCPGLRRPGKGLLCRR